MKLNWFKLVQICLDLDQLAKNVFFSEKCPQKGLFSIS